MFYHVNCNDDVFQSKLNDFDGCRPWSIITKLYSCFILSCSLGYFFIIILLLSCFRIHLHFLSSTFIQQPETSRTCKVMEMKFAQKFLFRIKFIFFLILNKSFEIEFFFFNFLIHSAWYWTIKRLLFSIIRFRWPQAKQRS